VFLDDRVGFELAAHCFSLLLNTVDLKATEVIFKNMCFLFLSPNVCETTENSKDFITECMANRPNSKNEIKDIIRNLNFQNKQTTNEEPEVENEDRIKNEIEIDPKLPIKAQSLFSKFFLSNSL